MEMEKTITKIDQYEMIYQLYMRIEKLQEEFEELNKDNSKRYGYYKAITDVYRAIREIVEESKTNE